MENQYKIFFYKEGYNEPIWQSNFNNVELIAGMLAVSIGITRDLNTKKEKYFFDSNINVSNFRVLSEVYQDHTKLYRNQIKKGFYGIWFSSSNLFYYDLYTFQTVLFLHGAINLCYLFNKDFREYIYGFIFDSEGNEYDLTNFPIANRVKYKISYDIDDIEEEEQDNEKINEPFARTDEIIILNN